MRKSLTTMMTRQAGEVKQNGETCGPACRH